MTLAASAPGRHHLTGSGSTFTDWTQGRTLDTWGTNFGAAALAFQSWRHFKEAFAPELIERALRQHPQPVTRCLDPFGGSGTTALACQFLGVQPITIEVNPFLADLIEAKLASYDADALARDLGTVIRRSTVPIADVDTWIAGLPPTFVEPGLRGRWIFNRDVAGSIAGLLSAISDLPNEDHRRLFRVLVGGILIDASNVVVNGKGRRYRGGWEARRRPASAVAESFRVAAQRAICDIHRYGRRPCRQYEIRRGDCRDQLKTVPTCDIAVFSPPYPNSFDYTDVYNIELWMLGYLTDAASNHRLRTSAISSHVQVSREFAAAPSGSPLLETLLCQLSERSEQLWDRRLPQMIGAYFADMVAV
ncbi:MAG: DNA methyltransferase, partial [Chloroflexota bacterium]